MNHSSLLQVLQANRRITMKLTLVLVVSTVNAARAFVSLFWQQQQHQHHAASRRRTTTTTTGLKAGHDDAYAAQYNAFAANYNAHAAERGVAPIAPVMPSSSSSSSSSSSRDDGPFRSDGFRDMAENMRYSGVVSAPPSSPVSSYGPIEPYREQTMIAPMQPYGEQTYGSMQPSYREQRYGGALRPDSTLGQRSVTRTFGSDPYMGGGSSRMQQVQGNSRSTYSSYGGGGGGSQQMVDLTTDGRPLDANVETWIGPNNTPQKLRVYAQDGYTHGIRSIHSSSSAAAGHSTLSVRNQGPLEFPLNAAVTQLPQQAAGPVYSSSVLPRQSDGGALLQGEGGVKTWAIPPNVQSIMLTMQTEGRPMYANLEVLEGPNNVKVGADLYNDGMHGPSQLVIRTPGFSKSLRLKNTGPMAYPYHATVEAHSFGDPYAYQSRPNPNMISRFDSNGRYVGDPLEYSNSAYGGYGGGGGLYGYSQSNSRFDSNGRYREDPYRYGGGQSSYRSSGSSNPHMQVW